MATRITFTLDVPTDVNKMLADRGLTVLDRERVGNQWTVLVADDLDRTAQDAVKSETEDEATSRVKYR